MHSGRRGEGFASLKYVNGPGPPPPRQELSANGGRMLWIRNVTALRGPEQGEPRQPISPPGSLRLSGPCDGIHRGGYGRSAGPNNGRARTADSEGGAFPNYKDWTPRY
jgi:hypothetical protein